MKVRIKYFGMIAERLGKNEDLVELDNSSPILLKDWCLNLHPEIDDLVFQVAVDHSICETTEAGQHITEIAILPPFAGG